MLGKIPDLISNNLLTPCLQENHVDCTLSIQQTHSPPAWRLTGEASDDGDEILWDLKDKRLEGRVVKFIAYGGQDSSSSSEPVGQSSIIYFSESKRVGATTGEGEGQEHEDEDETEEDKEVEEEQEQDAQERTKPGCHPVYGMLLCTQDEEADEYRHDRKDSGVFMHSLEDEFEALWVQGPLLLACALTHPSC